MISGLAAVMRLWMVEKRRPHRPDSPPRRRSWLFPPACGGLLLAFADAIAGTLNDGAIGVMKQAIQQRDDASGVGEDLVPFLEGTVCGQDHRRYERKPV